MTIDQQQAIADRTLQKIALQCATQSKAFQPSLIIFLFCALSRSESMTPLQQAWKRVWSARRTEGPEFESALFALVDAATAEGKQVGSVSVPPTEHGGVRAGALSAEDTFETCSTCALGFPCETHPKESK